MQDGNVQTIINILQLFKLTSFFFTLNCLASEIT